VGGVVRRVETYGVFVSVDDSDLVRGPDPDLDVLL
jgi:hypothetical protein